MRIRVNQGIIECQLNRVDDDDKNEEPVAVLEREQSLKVLPYARILGKQEERTALEVDLFIRLSTLALILI